MAKTWCLLKEYVEKFKKGLRDGEISPEKLSSMTSEERKAFLGKYVGVDNASQVNGLFESKLLLKNQKAGMVAWAKRTAGLKPEVRRDIIAKIDRLDTVLNPASEEVFMKDLASTRLSLNITSEEAKTIYELTNKMEELQVKRDPKTLEFPTQVDRLTYGAAKVTLGNYIADLKAQTNAKSVMDMVKDPVGTVVDIAGVAKSIKASLDNSALLRQGWKVMLTNPGIWLKNSAQSFVNFAKSVGNAQKVSDGIMADIVSMPNYEKMVKAKLAIGVVEDAYPSSLPERIPGLGRLFKASETTYNGFLYKTRADVFNSYLDIMEKSGVDSNSKDELLAIGKVVNSLTGRGSLGAFETVSKPLNNVFFSIRNLKSHIDVLTAHTFSKNMTPFARKRAAINLLKIILGASAILAIARAINKDSVELDPRSSDFGKIKVGDTRFDVTGGMSSVMVLVARVLSGATKSSTSGIVKPLNSGDYGSQTSMDVVYSFFENKLSPGASVAKDILKGQDFNGNKPTILGEANNLFAPLPLTNYLELKDNPNSAPLLLAIIADSLGVGTNTYGMAQTDWDKSTAKEMTAFKESVNAKQFKEANDKFNSEFKTWFKDVASKQSYQLLSDVEKQSLISSAKDKIKGDIFKSYHFKYKAPKADPKAKSVKKQLLPK